MSKKNQQPEHPKEERGVEAVTIAWMLTFLATVVGMLCSLAAYLLVRGLAQAPDAIRVLPGLLLVISGIGGIFAIVLTPFVLRLRKTKPPLAITQAVLFASALPWLVMLLIELIA